VGVQEVRWKKGGIARVKDYLYLYLFYGNKNENNQIGTGFFVHQRITS
jgi:hypothetical protein